MSRRRKVNPLRLVLIILIVIALCFIAFFAIKLVLKEVKTIEEKKDEPITEIVPSSNEETKIVIEDYKVYFDDDEDLGFNFVVATLKFTTTKESLYYDLSNLTNSERDIKISEIDGYISKLENNHYDLAKIELAKEIKSTSNTVTANILIPFVNKTGVLNVYNGEKLTFDLSKNVENASSLKKTNQDGKTVIKTNDYDITITEKPYLSTMMTRSGEEFDSSGIAIYTFKIKVNNVKDGVKIERAQFIKDGSDEAIEALDETYQSLKVENILMTPLSAGSEGALFFELYRNNDAAINYNGVLKIQFSDNMDSWVELSTTIK